MAFVLLGPIGFFASGFLWIIPLIEIVARWGAIRDEARQEKFALLWKNGFLFVVPLYGLVTVAWAINPQDAAATALKAFSFIMLGAILIGVVQREYTAPMRDRAIVWAACGIIVTEIVILAELASGGVLYKALGHEKFSSIVYSRGSVILALTLMPVAAALARRAKWAFLIAFVTLGLATIFLLSSESAMLAVTVSGAVYALVWWRKYLFWAVLALPIGFTLVAPAINLLELDNNELCAIKDVKPTVAHRIIIWKFATETAMRKPLAGWGMDSARAIPGGGESVRIARCMDPATGRMTDYVGERVPLHTHNAAIQLWLELGAVGAVIAALSIVHLLRRAQRGGQLGRGDEPLIAAVFSSCFIVYSVSFGIWQSWLIFACIVLFALTSLSGQRSAGKA